MGYSSLRNAVSFHSHPIHPIHPGGVIQSLIKFEGADEVASDNCSEAIHGIDTRVGLKERTILVDDPKLGELRSAGRLQ
jgi:hypothetical protein